MAVTVSVKNWRQFQHYAKRNPPWIKLYHSLLDDEGFAALDAFAQLLYFKLLLAASRKDNLIPSNVDWMATELSLPRAKVRRALVKLIASGFVLSSDPASASASADARPLRQRTEAEGETEAEADGVTSAVVPLDAARREQPPDFRLPDLKEMP